MKKGLVDYFEDFIDKKSIFKNRSVLQSNYLPQNIFHRDEQINIIAKILAPALKYEKPSNVFVYGKTGTGKTLTIKSVLSNLKDVSVKKGLNINVVYLNCKLKRVADTEYRLIAQIARELGKAIPPTGLPTDEVYNIFFKAVDKEKQVLIIVLDEIDQLGDEVSSDVLYNLTRINSELSNAVVSLVGISNDVTFVDNLDSRVKSSLSEEEVLFPPYNALQIQDILKERVKVAFEDNVLEEGLIEKCAAFAARDHGDARRAIELLRVTAELSERNNSERVLISDLDVAEEKIEKDRIFDLVVSQPKQYQALMYSLIKLKGSKSGSLFTGEIYDLYQNLCSKVNLRPLTQRRVSDIISEFDMLGVINAKVISKGRYGRTREIMSLNSSINLEVVQSLEKNLGLL